MMYTSGIMKIFSPVNACNLMDAKYQAKQAGYSLLNYKGDIYFKYSSTKWEKTELRLIDFTVSF